MIPPRWDGMFLSRLDGKLRQGLRVYVGKNIPGMKPFKCLTSCVLPQRAIARAQKSKFIPPSWD